MAARESTSTGRQSKGASMDPEPRGSMRAHLYENVELGSYHGPGGTC
jgi:hypothetical protein